MAGPTADIVLAGDVTHTTLPRPCVSHVFTAAAPN